MAAFYMAVERDPLALATKRRCGRCYQGLRIIDRGAWSLRKTLPSIQIHHGTGEGCPLYDHSTSF